MFCCLLLKRLAEIGHLAAAAGEVTWGDLAAARGFRNRRSRQFWVRAGGWRRRPPRPSGDHHEVAGVEGEMMGGLGEEHLVGAPLPSLS